jgi:hypothetical protein
MPYPRLPAFSRNNFVDHFTGSSLDASKWTAVGSVTVTDSTADINPGANAAGFIYYNTKIDKTKSQLWMACINYVSASVATFSPPFLQLLNGASTPAADTHTNIAAKTLVKMDYENNGSADSIGPLYFSNAGTQTYWNDNTPAWTTTYPAANWHGSSPIRTNDYYVVGIEIDAVNSRWRTLNWGQTYTGGFTFNQGLRLFHLSDWVTWANTRDSSTGIWLVIGPAYNDDANAHELKVEWVRYAEAPANTVLDGWFDISSTTGPQATKAQTQHHWSYDGYIWVPQDRTTLALSVGGSTYDDLDISPTSAAFDGVSTDYLAYAAVGSVTASSINIASATHASPQNGTWTKSANNPLITLSAGESLLGFPYLFRDNVDADPNKRWKLLFSVKATADSKWRLHLATSPDPPTGATWTRQGVILDVGSAGAFDEQAARDGIPVYYNGQWEVWYEGWVPPASGWSIAKIGRATGPTLTALTKDGSGARISYAANADSTLTANLTGRTVTLSSTTGMLADGAIVLVHSATGTGYSYSRIRKVTDSTHVELYTGLDGFTTTLPDRAAQNDSVRYWSPRAIVQVGSQWWFYVNIWGPFQVYDGASYAAYRHQVGGVMISSDVAPAGATPVMDQLSFPGASPTNYGNATESVENMTLLNQPFTGEPVIPQDFITGHRPAPFAPSTSPRGF